MVRRILIYNNPRNPTQSTLGQVEVKIERDGDEIDNTPVAENAVALWCWKYGYPIETIFWAWVL